MNKILYKLLLGTLFCICSIGLSTHPIRAQISTSSAGLSRYKVLKKSKPLQSQIQSSSTVYEIRFNYDLCGERLVIPSGSILKFEGGSISNGIIVFNDCGLIAANYQIFGESMSYEGKPNTQALYPEWFGAKCDGETDDGKAIQQSINFGIPVSLGAREYRIFHPLTLSNSTVIEGSGWNTVLKAIGCNAIESSKSCRGVLIRDMRVEGDKSDNQSGLYLTVPMPKLIIQNLHVSNFGSYGLFLKKSWDYAIENINVTSNGTGFYAEEFNSSSLEKIVAFQNKGIGVNIVSSANARISGTIQENGLTGLVLQACHACFVNVYGEQNGHSGTTNEETSEIVLTSGGPGNEVSCDNFVQFYLNGGDGSDMISKYGVYLNWTSRNFINGFSIRHQVKDVYETTNSNKNILTNTSDNSKLQLTSKNIRLQ